MSPLLAAGGPEGLPRTLLVLAAVLVLAKAGGLLAVRCRVPVVLGELAAGIFLGFLGRTGFLGIPDVVADPNLTFLAEIGVILLLFEVGVENTVSRLLSVGVPALRVAILGVAAPFVLGWGAAALVLPSSSSVLHVFVGATLCATSVGITARVMKDAGRADTPEGRTILGAAVIDDVLGLIVLAVVVRLAAGGSGDPAGVALVATGEAVLFLAAGIGAGVLLTKPLFRAAARLRLSGMLLALSLALCFSFAWGAHAAGLAPIIGAFAAGLVLEPTHSALFRDAGEEHQLEHLLHPLSSLLVPVFFVHVGARVDIRAFGDPAVLGVGLALSAAAIIGKQVCALGVARGTDGVAVGLGMIPRGEVGLVFAGIGASLVVEGAPLFDAGTGAAVVFMVAVTTLLGPLLLVARLRRTPAAAA
ncbi:MAG TPA: cation:proton antiporter [Planctomycetota bacterium]|nr:cation:proton antiporter [Planctomycetota bacterium]